MPNLVPQIFAVEHALGSLGSQSLLAIGDVGWFALFALDQNDGPEKILLGYPGGHQSNDRAVEVLE